MAKLYPPKIIFENKKDKVTSFLRYQNIKSFIKIKKQTCFLKITKINTKKPSAKSAGNLIFVAMPEYHNHVMRHSKKFSNLLIFFSFQ